MYKLKIINSSVRDERKGPLVVKWVAERVKNNENFEVEVIDLAAENLPMMNEPIHPNQRKYKYEHLKDGVQRLEKRMRSCLSLRNTISTTLHR
jgi:NAD(P)H-dependent FMN reductase